MPSTNIGTMKATLAWSSGAFRREVKKDNKHIRAVGNGAQRTGKAVRGMGKNFAAVRPQLMALAGGLSAVTAAMDIGRTVVGYEKTMAELMAVTGATDETMSQFATTARQMGATTAFSAQQAGEGLLFLSRAGFDAEQSIAALPATLNLAIAGQLELGDAADKASNIISAFRMEASETGRVVDSLVVTSNKSNTSVEQLAEGMKFAAPLASVLGRSVEETAAAIGVLSDNGIQGSLAGTNLRAVMAALVQPTQKARQALSDMGIEVSAVNPATNDLASIFKRLRDANIDANKAIDIFGAKMGGAAVILSKGTERVEQLTAAQVANVGASQKMADVLGNTLSGKAKALRSALEELWLQTGDKGLAGAMGDALEVSTALLKVWGGMGASLGEQEAGYRRLAVAIESVVLALAVGKVAAWGQALHAGIVAAGGMTAAMAKLTAVMRANPIIAVASAVMGVVGAFRIFNSESQTAIDRARALDSAIAKSRTSVDSLRDAQVRLNRAVREGNLEEEIAQRKRVREALTTQAVEVEKIINQFGGLDGTLIKNEAAYKRWAHNNKNEVGEFKSSTIKALNAAGFAWKDMFVHPKVDARNLSNQLQALNKAIRRTDEKIRNIGKGSAGPATSGGMESATAAAKATKEELQKLLAMTKGGSGAAPGANGGGGLFGGIFSGIASGFQGMRQNLAAARVEVADEISAIQSSFIGRPEQIEATAQKQLSVYKQGLAMQLISLDQFKVAEAQILAQRDTSLQQLETEKQQQRLMALQSAGIMEQEQVALQQQMAIEQQRQYLTKKIITEEEFERAKLAIQKRYSDASATEDKKRNQKRLQDQVRTGSQLISASQQLGSAMLAENKGVNAGMAVANTAAGVTAALATQNWGAAFATATAGLVQMKAISSARKGGGNLPGVFGGGGEVNTGGGGGDTPNAGAGPGDGQPTQQVMEVRLLGRSTGTEDLIALQDDADERGYGLRFARA